MSFVPAFAPDAQSQWRGLDIQLQELVLDEMERLASNPPLPPTSMAYGDVFHETLHARHYVFLRAIVDRPRREITVVGIVHLQKPTGV